MFFKKYFYLIFLLILSCQQVELIKPLEIDVSKLDKISISAKELKINIKYDPVFSDQNIEDQIRNSPIDIIKSWTDENIEYFGNQNNLVINIYDASISKKEIDNKEAKKFEEKKIFQYEVLFLVDFELYDDSGYLIANTSVETLRSTTSKKFISLNENEIIISELLNKAIKDFVNETKLMMDLYMSEYVN